MTDQTARSVKSDINLCWSQTMLKSRPACSLQGYLAIGSKNSETVYLLKFIWD